MDRLNKVAEDVTELKVMLARIEIILERNTADVERHIKRTDLLEGQIAKAMIPYTVVKWSLAVLGPIYSVLKIIALFGGK